MPTTMDDPRLDCVIIGGGPAGLTAAIYLARFRRRFTLIDGGASRAAWVPVSHNHAGFPDGVTGTDLLTRMATQARRYGATTLAGDVETLQGNQETGFTLTLADRTPATQTLTTRTVLLATGVVDIEPNLANLADAIARGLIRYCPICDGFEATDRRIGVLCHGNAATFGLHEALFLRTYSNDVTLLSADTPLTLDPSERAQAAQARITLINPPVASLHADTHCTLTTTTHTTHQFDTLYAALGTRKRSTLAQSIGATLTQDGYIATSPHQQTSIPGLYAAGDIVRGLNQISVAMGEAAIAATAIHNALRSLE